MTLRPGKLRGYVSLARELRAGKLTPRDLSRGDAARASRSSTRTIGAFVDVNRDGARKAADASAARWRAGKPLSPIDGMPVAIKDIIETADMPTGQGSPLWEGADVAPRFGERARAARGRRHHHRQDHHHRIRREPSVAQDAATRTTASARRAARRAARPPRSAPAWCRPGSAPRWSARSCGRRASAARSASSRASARSTAAARTTISARAARARSARRSPTPGRCCARSPTAPAAIRALSGSPATSISPSATQAGAHRRAARPAAGARPAKARARRSTRRGASSPAPASSCVSRADDPDIEAVEKAIADALPLTMAINAWEGRWPLNTYADIDAQKLSGPARDRLKTAEAMTQKRVRRADRAPRRGARGLRQGREPTTTPSSRSAPAARRRWASASTGNTA